LEAFLCLNRSQLGIEKRSVGQNVSVACCRPVRKLKPQAATTKKKQKSFVIHPLSFILVPSSSFNSANVGKTEQNERKRARDEAKLQKKKEDEKKKKGETKEQKAAAFKRSVAANLKAQIQSPDTEPVEEQTAGGEPRLVPFQSLVLSLHLAGLRF
jgi:hypothetical protein